MCNLPYATVPYPTLPYPNLPYPNLLYLTLCYSTLIYPTPYFPPPSSPLTPPLPTPTNTPHLPTPLTLQHQRPHLECCVQFGVLPLKKAVKVIACVQRRAGAIKRQGYSCLTENNNSAESLHIPMHHFSPMGSDSVCNIARAIATSVGMILPLLHSLEKEVVDRSRASILNPVGMESMSLKSERKSDRPFRRGSTEGCGQAGLMGRGQVYAVQHGPVLASALGSQ